MEMIRKQRRVEAEQQIEKVEQRKLHGTMSQEEFCRNVLHQRGVRLSEGRLAEIARLRMEFDQDKGELWESTLAVCTYRPAVDKTCARAQTEQAKVEQRVEKAMEVMERNVLEAARFEECAVEIAELIRNILKAFDIAERAILTLKKLKYVFGKKVMAESEREESLCKKPLMSCRLRDPGGKRKEEQSQNASSPQVSLGERGRDFLCVKLLEKRS